ncbi:MAG: acyl-CoA dehydrogenase family protein, partial [Devosia sp.]|nr:acyl-CoA dehydrogenase family protein [Devosia sp.]
MTDLNTLSDDDFRQHVRGWIEANYPPELRNPPKRLHWSENQVWYFKLAEQGWLCPSWPREHGGMGLSAGKQIIMVEEYERHGVARTNDHGILMVGPLLIAHGTQEQRDFF